MRVPSAEWPRGVSRSVPPGQRRAAPVSGLRRAPGRIRNSDGGVSGSCALARRSPFDSSGRTSSGQKLATPMAGRPVMQLARPAGVCWGQRFERRPQIVEHREDEPAAAPEKSLQRPAFGRFEQHREIGDLRQGRRQRRCRAPCRADRSHRRPSRWCGGLTASQPRCHSIRHRSAGRSGTWGRCGRRSRRSHRRSLSSRRTPLALPEPHGRRRPRPPCSRRWFENDRCRQRVGPAPPQPHRAGVAGTGRHALAQAPRRAASVAIEPDGSALGFGHGEAAGHEVAQAELEFAQHHRIAPPRDSISMARSWRPGSVAAPLHVQSSPSSAARASRSSRVSHCGCSLR